MKIKRILRFYFNAEGLERALNSVIERRACAPDCDGIATAQGILELIADKTELERLWAYLNGALSTLTENERRLLSAYCVRGKACASGERERKALNCAVIKFLRRARRLSEFGVELSVLDRYFCLI